MRMPAAARHQWARLDCCPSQDHRARTPLLVVLPRRRGQPASRLCFATTEWPLRGQQALRQPRNCTAVGLQCLAWARGAEAAHEACASLCMSHWSAEGGQKTSTSKPSRKTRDRAFCNSKLLGSLQRSADHQTRCEDVCEAADIPFLAGSSRAGQNWPSRRYKTVLRKLDVSARSVSVNTLTWEKARAKARTAPQ